MTTLLEIELVCPVCTTHFFSRAIGSITRVGQDTYFRPRVAGLDPMPHYVHACPQCCFAAFEGDFEQMRPEVHEFVQTGALREAAGAESPDAWPGSTKYLLAAVCYDRDSRATRLRIADLYLRASWCSRIEGNRRREICCQIEAALRFEEALQDAEVRPEQEQTILYLLGELYRRMGRYELAEVLLEMAAQAEGEYRDERVAELAQQQCRATRLNRSDNMVISL